MGEKHLREEVDALTEKLKGLPYVAIHEISPVVTRYEIRPVSSGQCYLAVTVDVYGNVEVLVDESGTFDNLVWDEQLILKVLDDILSGSVTRCDFMARGYSYKTTLSLKSCGLQHVRTQVWMWPLLLFSNVTVNVFEFSPYQKNC